MGSLPSLPSDPQGGSPNFSSPPFAAWPLPILVRDGTSEAVARFRESGSRLSPPSPRERAVVRFLSHDANRDTQAGRALRRKLLEHILGRVFMPHGEAGCWIVGRGRDYARIDLRQFGCWCSVPLHRFMLAITTDFYSDGHWVSCHRCGVVGCVNPSHLYWGDAKTNAQDVLAHGQDAASLNRQSYWRDVGDDVFRLGLISRKWPRGSYLGPGSCGRCVAAITASPNGTGSRLLGLEPGFLRRAGVAVSPAESAPVGASSST